MDKNPQTISEEKLGKKSGKRRGREEKEQVSTKLNKEPRDRRSAGEPPDPPKD